MDMSMDKETLKELLRQARERYQICWNYFNNCDSDMVGAAIHNLKTCEYEIENLNKALKGQETYIGNW